MAKWLRMNGSVGCLPDSVEAYDTREDAIDAACDLFDDLDVVVHNAMRYYLGRNGIFYFPPSVAAGADYVEVVEDTEGDWEEETC